jgi:hypothetical protein
MVDAVPRAETMKARKDTHTANTGAKASSSSDRDRGALGCGADLTTIKEQKSKEMMNIVNDILRVRAYILARRNLRSFNCVWVALIMIFVTASLGGRRLSFGVRTGSRQSSDDLPAHPALRARSRRP